MYSQAEIILMLATEHQRALVEEAEQRRRLAEARRAQRLARRARRAELRQARRLGGPDPSRRELSPPAGTLTSCAPAGASAR